MNIIGKPNSRQSDYKWIPEGIVAFLNGPDLTERREWYENATFGTK